MSPSHAVRSKTVVALVVSHNRAALLRRCLQALANQETQLSGITVVDCASTDESVQVVRTEFPFVDVVELRSNVGGAGGFAAGVNRLLQQQVDWMWLMDDDAAPMPDALTALIEEIAQHSPEPGFVAAMPVDESLSPIQSHRPIPVGTSGELQVSERSYPAVCSTFVGTLINAEVARRTFLPMGQFFIWYDDTEYTSRIAHLAGGYGVPAARIRHPATALNPTILRERLYFDTRNRIWLWRNPILSSPRGRRLAIGGFWQQAVELFSPRQFKLRVAWRWLKGCVVGVFTRPRIVYPTPVTRP